MLQNLNTLKEQLRKNYLLTFWDEDRELPLIFRNQVEIVETYDISFNSNTFVAKSNNGLKIFFPNQLWSIAAFFSEYYHAINEYVVYIKDILGIDKESIKECCNNEIKTEIIINKYSEILLVEVLHHFAAKVIELNDSPVLIHRIFFPDI